MCFGALPAPFFVSKYMLTTILASKLGMGAAFVKGRRIPVTRIIAGPCVVTQIKNTDTDGYFAVQLGFGERKIKNITKPMQGHLKKTQNLQESKTQTNKTSKTQNFLPRYIKEVRLDKEPDVMVGEQVLASDIFNAGDIVSVSGISKGKGFQGVVKRWNFAGGPRTHGQSDRERAPGSIGQGTTPGRVYKGKHMAGKMGEGKVTIKNLQVVSVDPSTNTVEISGSLPGRANTLLTITRLAKGELEGIQEAVAQVVEGEAPAEGATTETETKTSEVPAKAEKETKVEEKQSE